MIRKTLVTASCAAALIVPSALMAQQDTTRMRDSSRTTRTTTTQSRATSQMRLPVQKRGEAAGTLDLRADSIAAAARADSIAAAERARRTADSLAAVERARADSIAAVERARADSIAAVERARADSIAAEEARRAYMARYRLGGNGWYMGVSAGASAPTGDFENLGYNSGYNVNVPIGWHKENSLLGIRMDFGYNQFSGREFIGNNAGTSVALSSGTPKVLSATFNVTAQTPTFIRNVNLYGVGGGGLYHFRNVGSSALGGFLGNDVLTTNETNAKTNRNKLGAQVGAGLDWQVGTSSVFLETRFVNVFADRDDTVQFRDFFGDNRSSTLRWVPITIGVKIR